MSDPEKPSDQAPEPEAAAVPGKADAKAAREARLARALRANLRRRKAPDQDEGDKPGS
jgi:hypothetical protein